MAQPLNLQNDKLLARGYSSSPTILSLFWTTGNLHVALNACELGYIFSYIIMYCFQQKWCLTEHPSNNLKNTNDIF